MFDVREDRGDCQCSIDDFCSFVKQNSVLKEEEKLYLMEEILRNKLSRRMYMVVQLTVWSVVAFWIDLILMPLLTLYIGYDTHNVFLVSLVPVTFIVVNFLLKFIYINFILSKSINVYQAFVASLPYVGALFLLKGKLYKKPLLQMITKRYLIFKKNEFKDLSIQKLNKVLLYNS